MKSSVFSAALLAAAFATSVIATPKQFYLQSKVISGNSNKAGLYLEAYHTGAGTGDATLGNITTATKGFLNGTDWQFALGGGNTGHFVYSYDTNYAEWEPLQVDSNIDRSNVNWTTSGTTGLIVEDPNYTEFGGFIACDWWHGVPQIFTINSGFFSKPIPSTCSNITLVPVAV